MDDETPKVVSAPAVNGSRAWQDLFDRWVAESRMDDEIGRWVLEHAEKDVQALIDGGVPPVAGIILACMTAAMVTAKTDLDAKALATIVQNQMPQCYELARRIQERHGDSIEQMIARGGHLETMQ